MRVGLVVSANKWTGAGAVAERYCRALHATGVDARLLFVGGRNLERRLAGRLWAVPELVKERGLPHLRSNLRAVTALAEESDIVISFLPHDHLLCVAAGVHRRAPLVRGFRSPRHLRRDPYHRYLDHRLSGALLAHSSLESSLSPSVGRLPIAAPPVPLDDRFQPADGSEWRLRLGIPPHCPVIGAVGKLAKGRGFELLLETASRIEAPTRVVIVGHGELRPQLQTRAVRLGLEERVHWAGYQDEALPEIYAALDVFIFTAPGSDWGHRSISEAQGCGRPVVAASYPGVADLVDDGIDGRIIDGDPRVLATAVSSLINESESARRLGGAATSAVSGRRMAPVGNRLARFLEGILAG
jgi:glycosyltransferase involved in cell wall biosynthesis